MICSADDAIRLLQMWAKAKKSMWISVNTGAGDCVFQFLGRILGVSARPERVLTASWGITTELALRLEGATFEYGEVKDDPPPMRARFVATIDSTLKITLPDRTSCLIILSREKDGTAPG